VKGLSDRKEMSPPILAKIAKNLFAAPATSTCCEGVFSKAGIVIAERRTSLKKCKYYLLFIA